MAWLVVHHNQDFFCLSCLEIFRISLSLLLQLLCRSNTFYELDNELVAWSYFIKASCKSSIFLSCFVKRDLLFCHLVRSSKKSCTLYQQIDTFIVWFCHVTPLLKNVTNIIFKKANIVQNRVSGGSQFWLLI